MPFTKLSALTFLDDRSRKISKPRGGMVVSERDMILQSIRHFGVAGQMDCTDLECARVPIGWPF